MRRKIICFALTALLHAFCLPIWAQQLKKIPRIGFLSSPSASSTLAQANYATFREALRDLGYIEGQNIIIEARYAEESEAKGAENVAEMVRLKVDAIVTGSGYAQRVIKQTGITIPTVIISADPIGLGYVASLARPGGNMTGLSNLVSELNGKRLELLKETAPRISRIAALYMQHVGSGPLQLKEVQAAAKGLAVQIRPVKAEGPEELDRAFSAVVKERVHALLVIRSGFIGRYSKRIADFAASNRLPTISDSERFPEAGGLISYGVDLRDLYRRAAVYVDKILKGAKPADLPVEQPMKFDFVINLKTAQRIGLTIPPNVLVRADRVIK
jgi:putative ABC transport system substrate-binding protein